MIHDIISTMDNFKGNLSSLDSLCASQLNMNSFQSHSEEKKDSDSKEEIYHLIREVTDSSETLWDLLEAKDFAKALNLFESLKFKYSSIEQSNLDELFASSQFIRKNWEKVSTFDKLIEFECFQYLTKEGRSSEQLTDALCTIINIQNIDASQAFNLFLEQRSILLESMVRKNLSKESPITVFLNFLVQVQLTTYHILTIFLGHEESEPLLWSLKHLVKKEQRIQKDIRDYVKNKAKEWILNCKEIIPEDAFKEFDNCSALSEFKSKVNIQLQAFILDTDFVWKDISLSVLEENINLWSAIFHRRFVDGAKFMITELFSSIGFESKISQCIDNFQRNKSGAFSGDSDIGKYVWTPPVNADNILSSTRKCKANGITTKMKSVVDSIGVGVEDIVKEFNLLLDSKKVFNDTNDELQTFFKEKHSTYLNAITQDILQRIEFLRQDNKDMLNLILFLGRMSRSIVKGSTPYYRAYQIWVEKYIETFRPKLKHHVDTLCGYSPQDVSLKIKQHWKEVEISSDQGEHEFIPIVPSSFLMAILFDTVGEVSKVGSFAMDPLVLEFFAYKLGSLSYEIVSDSLKVLESTQPSKEVLIQLWFDASFLLTILGNKTLSDYYQHVVMKERNESKYDDVEEMIEWRKNVERLLHRIQQKIDPIELAFYAPHIRQNVKTSIDQYRTILGPLMQM